jgi:hypothetical protein
MKLTPGEHCDLATDLFIIRSRLEAIAAALVAAREADPHLTRQVHEAWAASDVTFGELVLSMRQVVEEMAIEQVLDEQPRRRRIRKRAQLPTNGDG